MPTNRRRSMRRMTVTGDAAVWLATDDAGQFFADPEAYCRRAGNVYQSPVQKLPGVRPWWDPLGWVLADMRAGKPAEERHAEAVKFLQALETAWNESR